MAEDCRKPKRGGYDVNQSAGECSERGKRALSAASGKRSSEDVEDAGARGDGEQQSCQEKSCKVSCTRHRFDLRGR